MKHCFNSRTCSLLGNADSEILHSVGVMTLLAATTTMHERPMYVGGTGLTWGLGTVLVSLILPLIPRLRGSQTEAGLWSFCGLPGS